MAKLDTCDGSRNACKWVKVNKKITCVGGYPTFCSPHIPFLDAESSDFHDADLIEATKKINQAVTDILSELPQEEGRVTAFIRTRTGILLVWKHDDVEVSSDAVTPDSDDETIARALKLIMPQQ